MANLSKVLLLESEFRESHLFATVIREFGFIVSFCSEADYALSTALKVKPDVIVLNSQLEGGAVKALKELGSSAHTANIPVLAINVLTEKDGEELELAGAQCCFSPEIDGKEIAVTVEKTLLHPLVVTEATKEIIVNPDRLKALEDANLLDCASEESFDRLTALAAKLLNAPTAVMSLVDKDRPFFMGQFGLGEPLLSARQTPLSHSFCQWVVTEKTKLIVEDASKHPVLCHNQAFREIGVVAYAGIPLTADTDQAIGSFCALAHIRAPGLSWK